MIQLIEACGASDQEYDQQSNDERSIGQVMPRTDVVGYCVGIPRWRQYCRKQSEFPYDLPQSRAQRMTSGVPNRQFVIRRRNMINLSLQHAGHHLASYTTPESSS
jgi:hypothetical protein